MHKIGCSLCGGRQQATGRKARKGLLLGTTTLGSGLFFLRHIMFNNFDRPAINRQAEVSLAALATEINDKHEAVERLANKSLERAKEAGDLLLQAKAQCKHGTWLKWLKANVKVSQQMVSLYMQLAENWDESKLLTISNLSIREALKILSEDDKDTNDSGESEPEEGEIFTDEINEEPEEIPAPQRKPKAKTPERKSTMRVDNGDAVVQEWQDKWTKLEQAEKVLRQSSTGLQNCRDKTIRKQFFARVKALRDAIENVLSWDV